MLHPRHDLRSRSATLPLPAVLLALAAVALLLAAAAGAPLYAWVLPAALGAALGAAASALHCGGRLRERDDFVAAVSHDLRTPIAQIRLLSETLLMGREADVEQRGRWLEVIAREGQVLDDRVANMLMVAHGDGLGAGASLRRVDLSALAEDVAAGYAPLAAGADVHLRVEVEPHLHADADPRLLRLALVNLLDNAVRYGPPGQTVTVSLRASGPDALLAVSDQGAGVPRRSRAAAWRPFVRLRGGRGAGLGLAVVQRIAAEHRGRAYFASVTSGARVCIALPLG